MPTSPTPADRPADQLHAAAVRARETGDPLHTALAEWLTVEADVIAARAAQPDGGEWAVDIGGDHALAVARQLLGTSVQAGCWCGHPEARHFTTTVMQLPYGCHDCQGWNGAHAYGQELPWAPDPEPAPVDLTADEAREMADELNTELYQARDALAFVGECCDIADRNQRPVTTGDVREWLRGARCGRQLLGATGEDDRAATEKKLAALQRRRDEVGAECRRRGRRVLEQSEQILTLERTLDEVRRQLGQEILRAGEAEAALAAAPPAPADRAAFEALAAEFIEKRGEYGDSSITDRARELRAVLAGEAQSARRRLTPREHDRAWHAIEGGVGEDGADPGTVLNAVLHALRIDPPTVAEEQAASPRRRLAGEAAAGAHQTEQAQPAPAVTEEPK
ncbi:hypothetical protein IFE09_27170 [Streptomyces microflavus]|nr:hypothetical protein [Streptomyces microflavus]QQZ56883.1 hypothetical protein IFE09_27170 [Streptomyces microflavus]